MINIDGTNYESVELDITQIEAFAAVARMPDSVAETLWNALLEEDSYSALTLQKRCDVFDIPLHSKVKLLGLLLCSSLGDLVIYMIDVLQSYGKEATFEQITKLYSTGFYSEKGIEDRWDTLRENREDLEWRKLLFL